MKLPWSKPNTRMVFVHQLNMKVVIVILVFEDFLVNALAFYIILLPLLVISTLILLLQMFNIIYFSRIVDIALLLRDVIVWNFMFYGVAINLIS